MGEASIPTKSPAGEVDGSRNDAQPVCVDGNKEDRGKVAEDLSMTYISGGHTPRNSSDDFVSMESMMESDVIVWFDTKAEDSHMSSFYSQRSQHNPFVNKFSFETL